MSNQTPQPGNVIQINITLFLSFFWGAIAWLFWPDTAEGWRGGVMAILCGLCAFGLLMSGLGKIKNQLRFFWYMRNRRMSQSDGFADEKALKREDVM